MTADDENPHDVAVWVSEHGSSRLRKAHSLGLIERSMAVYRDERLRIDRPGWLWVPREKKTQGIINPKEAALDELIATREHTDPLAVLAWSGRAVILSHHLGRATWLPVDRPDGYLAWWAALPTLVVPFNDAPHTEAYSDPPSGATA